MANALLGQRLKALRLNKNFTQQQAADALGAKNKGTISMWEKGVNEPSAITFLALCCAYEMPEAIALVKALGIENEPAFEFALVVDPQDTKNAIKTDGKPTEKKPYTFCPYCGEKLE